MARRHMIGRIRVEMEDTTTHLGPDMIVVPLPVVPDLDDYRR